MQFRCAGYRFWCSENREPKVSRSSETEAILVPTRLYDLGPVLHVAYGGRYWRRLVWVVKTGCHLSLIVPFLQISTAGLAQSPSVSISLSAKFYFPHLPQSFGLWGSTPTPPHNPIFDNDVSCFNLWVISFLNFCNRQMKSYTYQSEFNIRKEGLRWLKLHIFHLWFSVFTKTKGI